MEKITLEDFDIIWMEIFNKHDTDISDIEKSYNRWIKYQTTNENTSKEEKEKYKYVIWEDFSTAKSWIEREKKELDRQKEIYLYQKKLMSLPWYDRMLAEEFPTCNIKKEIVDAFINSDNGSEIRKNLCAWDLEPKDLKNALIHFAKSIKIPLDEIDKVISSFYMDDQCMRFMCSWTFGICVDGERVFRTLVNVCIKFNNFYVFEYCKKENCEKATAS